MPREKVELQYQIEYLSILDEDGTLDEDLEPDMPEDLLLRLHRMMLLGRRFDERMLRLQRQGRLGTFAPIRGQEASQLGAVAALRESDWMVPAFRETVAEMWRGRTMESVLLYYGGFVQGGAIPEGMNNLPTTIPVGTQTLHAVGLGYGIKYRQRDDVAMAFFGDGATSEGDFHEALNFAGVLQTPSVFACQNNQWAISVPRSRQTRSETLAQKALAHGVPGLQVDGNDVLAVYQAATEAVDRARAGDGPTLIENVTYRLSLHTTADDPKRYRTDEEVEEWEKRDPIPRFQQYLKDKGILSDERIEEVEEEIQSEIREAVEAAEKRMKELEDEPVVMFDHFYDEMPAYIQEQREAFMQVHGQSQTEKGNNHG
jgi:pyruvate dehydrogenase E1 component alpha subunit